MNSEYEKLAKMLTELHVRVHLDSEVLLESRNLKEVLFLAEAIDPQQVEAQTASTKQKLLQMTKLFPRRTAGPLIAELEKLIKAIPEGAKVAAALEGGDFADDPASKELAKKYDTSVMLATTGMSRIANSLAGLSKMMDPFKTEIASEDLEELTIGDLAKKAETDKDFKDKFVTTKQIAAGLQKSFVPGTELQAAFQRGSKAAATSAGSGGAKSGLGKLFAKAATFLGGFFTAPAGKHYPKLLEAFKTFVANSTPNEIFKLADQLKVQGKNVTAAANAAAQATASVAAAAGGAEVSSEKAASKVPSADLESELGGDEKAKAFVAALKGNESTKDLVESIQSSHSLAKVFFEAASYADILKVAQGVKGLEGDDAKNFAAKAAKFLKSKGADVDDAETAEPAKSAADAKSAAAAAEATAREAASKASSTTMGKAIHKAIIDYIQPFVDRKSLSGKARDALVASVEKDLSGSIDKTASDLADLSAGELKDALEKWYNALDPNLQKKLGGPVGSKKILQVAAKNIEDIVRKNFNVEETKNRKEDLIVERWQKMAGIK